MIRNWLAGDLESAPLAVVERWLLVGDEALRIRALRVLGERGHHLRTFERALSDPSPGMRRTAAQGLALSRDRRGVGSLLVALRREQADAPRWCMAHALNQLGQACEVTGRGDGFGWGTQDMRHLLEEPPDTSMGGWTVLNGRLETAGRREHHEVVRLLGLNGDPRSAPQLVSLLQAMDLDPGFGFRTRWQVALALGALGITSTRGLLQNALAAEQAEYEGRPGAGLGVQRPVAEALRYAVTQLTSCDSLNPGG